MTKRFQAPLHLAPLIARLERAREEPLRLVCSTPPRMGKTETLLHWAAQLLADDPSCQTAYLSYSITFAENKSRKCRDIANRAYVPASSDQRTKGNWRTGVEDGGMWATGIGGSLTGEGFHVMIVDDPCKDRRSAESATYREQQWDWLTGTAFTRLEPNGSIIVNMARWHEDDLAGRLIAQGWEHINLPAIDDEGRALWPERFPLERLQEIRDLSEYDWQSLYQGAPRARGSKVFHDAHYYEELPHAPFRVAIGIDCAYSERTSSDWSVAVVLAQFEGDPHVYVLDVQRLQVSSPAFATVLRGLLKAYPGAPIRWYTGGPELAVAQHLRNEGVSTLHAVAAANDKFVRAQPVASAWNRGAVLLPNRVSWKWLQPFIAEVCGFSGVKDRHDDQVDALAAAYDLLMSGAASANIPPPRGERRNRSLGGF